MHARKVAQRRDDTLEVWAVPVSFKAFQSLKSENIRTLKLLVAMNILINTNSNTGRQH